MKKIKPGDLISPVEVPAINATKLATWNVDHKSTNWVSEGEVCLALDEIRDGWIKVLSPRGEVALINPFYMKIVRSMFHL